MLRSALVVCLVALADRHLDGEVSLREHEAEIVEPRRERIRPDEIVRANCVIGEIDRERAVACGVARGVVKIPKQYVGVVLENVRPMKAILVGVETAVAVEHLFVVSLDGVDTVFVYHLNRAHRGEFERQDIPP